jgi:predicted PurR-regulated permease PerM
VAFVIIFGLITVFSKILSSNISQLMNELPKYQANISKLIRQGNAVLGMDILNEMHLAIESYDFTSILKQLFNSLSGVLGNIFLVILYVIFLLLEEEYLPSKLRGIFPINEQFQSSRELFQ